MKRDKSILSVSVILTIVFAIPFIFGVLQSQVTGFGIVDVKFTGEISKNSESNLLFVLANDGRTEKVVINTASENIKINPTTVTQTFNKSLEIPFKLITDNSEDGKWKITFQACNVEDENRCVTRTITGNILTKLTTRCGDNICQSTENINTCPQDCSLEEFLKKESDLPVKTSFFYSTLGKIFSGLFIASALISLFMFIKIKRDYE